MLMCLDLDSLLVILPSEDIEFLLELYINGMRANSLLMFSEYLKKMNFLTSAVSIAAFMVQYEKRD